MNRKLVSFDWAMKKLLRSKANFDILEGFLSELLKEDIKIIEILESEGNKETFDDKYNRVVVVRRNSLPPLIEGLEDINCSFTRTFTNPLSYQGKDRMGSKALS